ncbi:MAG: FHA domain-containing protein [Microbacteriaceae bacterium]|nr:MAG: FHA domain-containing protein [Microbacteriaceae bacterium]
MNCAYCGTSLAAGALFCVECGRSVAEPAPTVREQPHLPPLPPLPPVRVEVDAPLCPQCRAVVEEGAAFCGECGFVLQPATGAVPAVDRAEVVVEPPDDGAVHTEAPAVHVEPPAAHGETSAVRVETPAPAAGSRFAPRAPGTSPAPPPEASALEDIESTRVVARRAAGERYVLQFSTGESVVVSGTGLIGRNPAPEPGEYVDELVPIFDVGKSVSKSHVEFGQEGGRFWVADRYSTNGTVIRQPDAPPVRCEPGKRYMIARGSRVEIGEQFFVVS